MPRQTPKVLPPAEYLHQRFSYDPTTGELRWKPQPREAIEDLRCWASWNGKHVGQIAGAIVNGYRNVCLDYRYYKAHRIIWKMMTGDEPPDSIDHKDLNRANDRWSNLRAASSAKQAWNTELKPNTTTGYRGVKWCAGKYQARIQVNGVKRHIGTYETASEASEAYERAAREAFGEFYRPR